MKIEFIVQEVKVQILLNEFKVHFFIMQNAGYKHFGFLITIFLAPYYTVSRTFAKIKKYTDFYVRMRNH